MSHLNLTANLGNYFFIYYAALLALALPLSLLGLAIRRLQYRL
ncbi:hypothetical protein [Gloeobacter kilaueensis]|uniref:Uncharacterized protein n=1 Tax=Gloeobacter kilaueensis (strain ATCC BAA-2537 / CCAP 1431/1 / ULC 316 / JS1) TaxID=1183438 RepID=U5QKN0_GLOK1|nr:hypothetical protein [Gloeobacter kilaueensis]AGY58174.1 hypothetical protein GKIL_1928 [Gloeobacter kilaueensis JS1]